MMIKEFNIEDIDLKYFVAFFQIRINLPNLMDKLDITTEEKVFDQIFQLIDKVQKKNNAVIQFINDANLLNYEHLFNACYFVIKAFHLGTNISNKKNIELLLYLAANRQIKVGIETFGINSDILKSELLNCCIITFKDNLSTIKDEIIHELNGELVKPTPINEIPYVKLQSIKKFFEITIEQENVILNSYGVEPIDIPISILHSAVNELICEKMALLSLEKLKAS